MSCCFGRYYFRFVSFTLRRSRVRKRVSLWSLCRILRFNLGSVVCMGNTTLRYDVLRWCLLSFRWRRYLYKESGGVVYRCLWVTVCDV